MVLNDHRETLADERVQTPSGATSPTTAPAVRSPAPYARDAIAAGRASAHEPHRATAFPRFSLRTMLMGVAAACVLFALMDAVGPLGSVLLIWGALLIFAHVAANAWGTRVGRASTPALDEPPAAPPTKLAIERAITRTMPARVERRDQLGLMTIAVTAAGAAIGACAGAIVLLAALDDISLAGASLGACSAGVIGALFGFLASTFLRTTFGAWREAATIDAPRTARRGWLPWRRAK